MTATAAIAEALAEALSTALADAQAEGVALGQLDQQAVLELTVRRERFNTEAADLSRQLREALAGQRASDVPGLAAPLAKLNGLAVALAKQDRDNRVLAGRALHFTRAYVDTVRPRPKTYDRRGKFFTARGDAVAPSTVSHHT